MLYEDKRLAPYRGKEPFLFLSYSHKDAEQAAELILRLKQAGFRVWYDEGVIPATEWDEKIARAIKHSSYFVSLISEAYLASANCLDELNYARDLNKPQLLIYLEDVSLPEGLAMRLGRLLAVYRSRYDDPEAFYSHIFRAKGMKVCRGEPLLPAYENLEGTGSVSAETRYESAAGSYTGRLIAALVVLMLLVTALLAWNYRSEIGGLINDLRYSHVASQQNTEPASPIPEIIPDPSPMPTDNSADITVENPEPTATPAPTPAPTPTPPPTPTPTPAPTDTVVVVEPSGDEGIGTDDASPGEDGSGSDGSVVVVNPAEASPSPSPSAEVGA